MMSTLANIFVLAAKTHAFADETRLHPIAIFLLIVCGVAMFAAPRRLIVAPIFVIACCLSYTQRLVIFSLDFDALRVMIVVGWVRLVAFHETKGFRWRRIDTLLVIWSVVITLASMARLGGSVFVFRMGQTVDALGMYFLLRCAIRDWDDLWSVVKVTVALSIPMALIFLIEVSTGRNMFYIFGGVEEFTTTRDGRIRAKGPFGNSIVAGAIWAALMPMALAFWWQSAERRLLAVVGMLFMTVIVWECASSTPVLGVVMMVIGTAFFALRHRMRMVRWSLLLMFIVLEILATNHLWWQVTKLGVVSGSTGDHRARLLDQAVARVGEWWMVGTDSTNHWGYFLYDVTNHFLLQGVNGGFLGLGVFIAVVVAAYKEVGRLLRYYAQDRAMSRAVWMLGVSIFVHTMMFMAISYHTNVIVMIWHLHLAAAASMAGAMETARARQAWSAAMPAQGWGRGAALPMGIGAARGGSMYPGAVDFPAGAKR